LKSFGIVVSMPPYNSDDTRPNSTIDYFLFDIIKSGRCQNNEWGVLTGNFITWRNENTERIKNIEVKMICCCVSLIVH